MLSALIIIDLALIESHGLGPEAKIIAKELSHFDYQKSYAWQQLQLHFSSGVRFSELKSIASILIMNFPYLPPLSRSAVRSAPILIKWYNDNWKLIAPILPYIKMIDSDFNVIDQVAEISHYL